jgi:hypothetical protein
MTAARGKESTPLADTVSAVTTRRKCLWREVMARAFELRLWDDETNMKN